MGLVAITEKHRNYRQLAITASVWKSTGLDTKVAKWAVTNPNKVLQLPAIKSGHLCYYYFGTQGVTHLQTGYAAK